MSSSSSPTKNTTTIIEEVPYFVLQLSEGKAKALFTVPNHMAQSLIVHPILCRGASFVLQIDVVSQTRKSKHKQTTTTTNSSDTSTSFSTSFLSTEFYSPDPEETAKQIAQRIAIRMGGPSPVLSQFLF